MKQELSRREFLHRGCLAVLGAGLASCAGRPSAPDDATAPAQSLFPAASPTLIASPSPTRDRLPSAMQDTATGGTAEPSSTPERVSTATESPSPTAESTPWLDLEEARYYRRLDKNEVQCEVCFRRCKVLEGRRGFCRNKANTGGRYYSLVYGRPSALQIDPITKEPSFHMLPGGTIFCTGTAGCNNRCKFCQNWHLSQRSIDELDYLPVTPEETVVLAQRYECDAVSFTYNEPTTFYEHMFDAAKAAKQAGLGVLFHTNGGMNQEPLAALLKYADAVTVDLKAFTPEFYREVSSSQLEPVLRTLEQIYQTGIHLEIVNLVIPTLNDNLDDIRRMCRWICDTLSQEVPLHFTRFHPAYQLTDLPLTPIETLEAAAKVADEEGLHYVYIGNYPGHLRNSTFCPACGEMIVERAHFAVLSVEVVKGRCRFCDHPIPGIWWDV
jgi:pyruvate formate lyase activating enzyme